MTPINARDCAFQLDAAVRQLRRYADLMDHGIEAPVEIDLALNNIRGGLVSMGIFVTATKTGDQLHDAMKAGQQREAAMFDSVATCRAGLSMGR